VVIQQNSRKLLMMDILMSETCWAHKKWNKIASDIELSLEIFMSEFRNSYSSMSEHIKNKVNEFKRYEAQWM